MNAEPQSFQDEVEGAAHNGHFGCVCHHPIFVFNQFGDCEGAMLRPENVHSAHNWRQVVEPTLAAVAKRGPGSPRWATAHDMV